MAIDFACERADLVGQLVPIFNEQLAKDELTNVYDTLERPLIPVLIAVECAGIRIVRSSTGGAVAEDRAGPGAARMAQIYTAAGGEFNINSPKQLAEILFDKLQLPVLKRTGGLTCPFDGRRSPAIRTR